MSYDGLEQSTQDAQPVELFAFARGASLWRYTNFSTSILRFAHTWTPRPISRGKATFSGTVPKDTIEIRLPKDDAMLTAILDASTTAITTATVYRTHADEDISRALWKGSIERVSFANTIATLTCEPVFKRLQRNGIPQPYQRTCRHVFGGKGCFVDLESLKAYYAVTAVSGPRVTVMTIGIDVRGGTFKAADGQTRMIIDQSNNVLTLMRPISSVAVGNTVTIYPGCDRGIERCNQLGNLANFGGEPGIPLINPFSVIRSVFS